MTHYQIWYLLMAAHSMAVGYGAMYVIWALVLGGNPAGILIWAVITFANFLGMKSLLRNQPKNPKGKPK